MKLKLDENLPRDLADALTRQGHDVDTVLDEDLGGRNDPVVVQAATDDDRMVVTLDRGVGDIRSFPPGGHADVVVLRPSSQDPASIRFAHRGEYLVVGEHEIVLQVGRVTVGEPGAEEISKVLIVDLAHGWK